MKGNYMKKGENLYGTTRNVSKNFKTYRRD